MRYVDGELMRIAIVSGSKQGWCTRPGDSLFGRCTNVFADMCEAYYGVPGVLRLG